MFDGQPMPPECGVCNTCRKAEWSVLDGDGVARLTRTRHTSVYEEGEAVFHQNDMPHGIYCVESGDIMLNQYDPFGNDTGFRVVSAGETIGWRSFFAGQPHAATAVALTPCRVCLVPSAELKELLRHYPDLALAFLKTVAKDKGPQEGLLMRSPLLPVRTRVINLMLILARNQVGDLEPSEVAFRLPVKRHQIATMVGVRSETLSRTLTGLTEEGLFEIKGRAVTIPDYQRLQDEVLFDLPS